ncbi:LysR family transcriptional regulator [Caballeronia sp. 15715]|jgi:DNA-binding transcriptional LysR family regulator|uniref:LysR family transcriptional regulator n=1 Tax=Caballeronia sp. 15715 TaxID=3391030 RepID=UPI0039E67665
MRTILMSPLMHYVREVALEGSIRRAADNLHISPSAIARQIQQLEEQFGAALFERLPRGMRLTEAGEIVLETIQQFERNAATALSHVEELRGLKRGRVSIGALQTLGEEVLPRALSDLRKRYPGICFNAYIGNSSEIVRKLLNGELDIGMCWEPVVAVPLERLRVVQSAIGVAMQSGHPLARRDVIGLRDCAPYPVIFPSRDMLFRVMLDRINIGIGSSLTPVIETNSMSMMRTLVREGAGLVLTTSMSLLSDLATGKVVHRPLLESGLHSLPLCLLVRSERELPLAVKVVVEHFMTEMDKLAALQNR